MRIESIKKKILTTVEIPPELFNFFINVCALIEAKSPLALTLSDDLIQNEYGYGGLVEENVFKFIFFHNNSGKWSLRVTQSDLFQIQRGQITGLNLWKCNNPICLNFFYACEETCFNCDYE